MIAGKVEKFKRRYSGNWAYKGVALLITLILWATMLGQRNTVLDEELELQFILSPGITIVNDVQRRVTVKLTGPRMALKRFTQTRDKLAVDLTDVKEGVRMVDLEAADLELPLGVKVVEFDPSRVRVDLVRKRNENDGETEP